MESFETHDDYILWERNAARRRRGLLLLDLDASNSSTITLEDTNRVASITDPINGITFTASGTARPTLLSANQNGLDVMQGDGTAVTMSAGTEKLADFTELTIFAVVQDDDSLGPGDAQFVANHRTSPAGRRWYMGRNGDYVSPTTTFNANYVAVPGLSSAWVVRTMRWRENDFVEAWADGVLEDLSTTVCPSMQSSTIPNLTIFSRDGAAFWQGKIGRIRMFGNYFSNQHLLEECRDLKTEWGI